MWGNNPSQLALGVACRHFKAQLQDIKIISIGTGHFNDCYNDNTSHWGLLNGWKIRTLTEFVSSLQSESTFEQLSLLLPKENLLRLNFTQNKLIKPDEFAQMETLEQQARLTFTYSEKQIAHFMQEI